MNIKSDEKFLQDFNAEPSNVIAKLEKEREIWDRLSLFLCFCRAVL